MEVSLDAERDLEVTGFRRATKGRDVSRRIDHQDAPLTDGDEVGAVAKTLVDEGQNVHGALQCIQRIVRIPE